MAISLTTRLAAKVFFGGDGTVYGDLKPGERFRFPSNAAGTVCTKLKGGWYRSPAGLISGRKYRTGKGTAVVRAL